MCVYYYYTYTFTCVDILYMNLLGEAGMITAKPGFLRNKTKKEKKKAERRRRKKEKMCKET